jgi:acyl-CoA synthetase (AMP-forming)/AMP-acid ligase II
VCVCMCVCVCACVLCVSVLGVVEGLWTPTRCCGSSGTTGTPKGICLNHGVRFRYAALYALAMHVREDSVVLHSGSLVFNGAFVTLMPHLLMGCHYVLMSAFDAKEFVHIGEWMRVDLVGDRCSCLVTVVRAW